MDEGVEKEFSSIWVSNQRTSGDEEKWVKMASKDQLGQNLAYR